MKIIVGTYHVFGSGSAGVVWESLDDNLAALVAAMDDAKNIRVDDGHNGFGGTYSVPADWQERHPRVRVHFWQNPGYPSRVKLEGPGPGTDSAHARAGLRAGLTRVSELYSDDRLVPEAFAKL